MTQENLMNTEQSLLSQNGKPSLKWWQWLLLYPTLFASICGVIPSIVELIKATRAGVSWGNGTEAFIQDRLWVENQDCIKNIQPVDITTAQGFDVTVRVCPSGDVQIINLPYSRHQKAWWIDNTVFQQNTSQEFSFIANLSDILVPRALATSLGSEDLVAQTPTVICTTVLGEGRLLQRLQYPDGHCVDQIVNTFTGEVISQQQGSCSSDCQ